MRQELVLGTCEAPQSICEDYQEHFLQLVDVGHLLLTDSVPQLSKEVLPHS